MAASPDNFDDDGALLSAEQLEELPERQRLYQETRKDLLARQMQNSINYDKAILSLSTGALALSVAFINKVVQLATAEWRLLLLASWWLFVAALLSTLISFITSQKGIDLQLAYAEKGYMEFQDEYLRKTNHWAKWTVGLTYISGSLFVAAMIAMIVFISMNV